MAAGGRVRTVAVSTIQARWTPRKKAYRFRGAEALHELLTSADYGRVCVVITNKAITSGVRIEEETVIRASVRRTSRMAWGPIPSGNRLRFGGQDRHQRLYVPDCCGAYDNNNGLGGGAYDSLGYGAK